MPASQTQVKQFGDLDPRADLGSHFTASGVRCMLVMTERGAGALVVGGEKKHHVKVMDRHTPIEDVTHPPR